MRITVPGEEPSGALDLVCSPGEIPRQAVSHGGLMTGDGFIALDL